MRGFTRVLARSLRDILSPEVLRFVLAVGLGSILFWGVVLWIFWTPFSRLIASWIAAVPLVGSWEWLQSTGALLAAALTGYMLIIVTISILSSWLGEKLIRRLARRRYPGIRLTEGGTMRRSLFYTLKASALFLLLFFLTLPLLFVPVLGQLWMLWLWALLLKDPTAYDVGALFISDEQELKRLGGSAWPAALSAALFNYVPLLNIFAPVFAQILFMHYLLEKRTG